ncbi:patatin-like phospholipase family protein [Halobacteriovorax sp. GB3]|uniref:patatin-like phospholipase family protein n=1 Tax=Halobacteriovorax sp. GB3 TaxID=2719615 RepID=UPI00236208B0|nr:patatin-like phospholipase family protein [Halobacteriovorax sp. GB3]MDD0852590.1 patatin-like phospholipase family protein [Halobacteriovorax sp. GB3]
MASFIDRVFKRKIGLALGGGGARGAAHLGVLNLLNDKKIGIESISGTSAGAIVAAFYAFGISLDDMAKDLKTYKPVDISSLHINSLGIFKNKPLSKLVDRYLPEGAKIEDARIPLAIHTTDISTGEGVTLYKGDLKDALLASSCVPGIYIPKPINDRILVDGGLTENVPLSALNKLGAGFKIAVNLNGSYSYQKPDSIIDMATNSLDIAIDLSTREQIEKEADLAINLSLVQFSRTSAIHFDELVRAGYEQGERALKMANEKSFIDL